MQMGTIAAGSTLFLSAVYFLSENGATIFVDSGGKREWEKLAKSHGDCMSFSTFVHHLQITTSALISMATSYNASGDEM